MVLPSEIIDLPMNRTILRMSQSVLIQPEAQSPGVAIKNAGENHPPSARMECTENVEKLQTACALLDVAAL